jgi:hypothetical protein
MPKADRHAARNDSRGACCGLGGWHRRLRRWRLECRIAAVRLRPLGQRPGLASIGPRAAVETHTLDDRGETSALAVEASATAGAPLPEPRRAVPLRSSAACRATGGPSERGQRRHRRLPADKPAATGRQGLHHGKRSRRTGHGRGQWVRHRCRQRDPLVLRGHDRQRRDAHEHGQSLHLGEIATVRLHVYRDGSVGDEGRPVPSGTTGTAQARVVLARDSFPASDPGDQHGPGSAFGFPLLGCRSP